MENNQYFNPYMYSVPQFDAKNSNEFLSPSISPKDFYESQYMYYRYLTQMLEYNMKRKEFERMNEQRKT